MPIQTPSKDISMHDAIGFLLCHVTVPLVLQVSGSKSNSLNSQKLPGSFSYSLETRLGVLCSLSLLIKEYSWSLCCHNSCETGPVFLLMCLSTYHIGGIMNCSIGHQLTQLTGMVSAICIQEMLFQKRKKKILAAILSLH